MDSDICPINLLPETPDKEFTIVIPDQIRRTKSLSIPQKVLLSVIRSLDKDNHCFASNAYLAEVTGMSVGGVSGTIQRLKKKGWVSEVGDSSRRMLTFHAPVLKKGEARPLRVSAPVIESAITRHRGCSPTPPRVSSPATEGVVYKKIDLKEDLRKEEEEQLLPSHLFSPTGPQSPEMETEVLQIYNRHFPNYHPTVYQLDAILTSVQDKVTWSAACDIWALRGYQPRNVRGLLETYETELKRKKDPPKPKLSPHPVVTNDPCPYCSAGMPDRCSYVRQFGVCRW